MNAPVGVAQPGNEFGTYNCQQLVSASTLGPFGNVSNSVIHKSINGNLYFAKTFNAGFELFERPAGLQGSDAFTGIFSDSTKNFLSTIVGANIEIGADVATGNYDVSLKVNYEYEN